MNKTKNFECSVIVPVFNEADNIKRLGNALAAYLPKAVCSVCVIFVNDGSTDGSLARIKDACARHKDFFYISLRSNAGLSTALKAGIDVAQSQYVGYMDADLQTTPEDFNRLLAFRADYEMVTGVRVNRKDTGFKRMQSKVANAVRRMLTHDGMDDTGCPLKVMRTANAKRIPFFNGMHRFLPALILLQGGRVKQIPVRHFPRTAGTSKYRLWNRLTGPFVDCFVYRWMKSRWIDYTISDNNLSL